MPKYLGPYDEIFVDSETAKHPGDNLNVSAARLDQLRRFEGYRFESDTPEMLTAVHQPLMESEAEALSKGEQDTKSDSKKN